MIGLLEVVALSTVLLGVIVWVGTSVFAPARFRDSLSPGRRAIVARTWLYAPLWIPMLLVSAAMLPSMFGAMLGFGDHCTSHVGHHHHLCLLHPPHISNEPLAWIFTSAIGLCAIALVALRAYAVTQQSQLARALVRSSRTSLLGTDIRLLDGDEPVALTVGSFRPVVLLSGGLINAVDSETLDIVVAHERAHIERRDTMWAAVDSLMAAILPRTVRTNLLGELNLAREQACDNAAASRFGALNVANALTKVARLQLAQPSVGLSIGAAPIERRVVRLLDAPADSRWWPLAPVASLLVVVALGAGPVHTLIENITTHLLH